MITLNFETLTPLHISNGNQLSYNLDYILIDNYVAKLNNSNASKVIAKANLFDFKRDYKFVDIIKIIEKNKHIFSDESFDYKVSAVETFLDFIKGEKRDGQKFIQEFINSNGNFYIPASSIKGMFTTILHRDPDKNPLGINPNQAKIEDKFVITDSEYIGSENFSVEAVNRPPSINLITLDPGVEFTSQIRSKGNLNISILRKKLENYSENQINKARPLVRKFKEMEKEPRGATAYLTILEKILFDFNLEKNEYLVNLGFGGGSYFKLYDDVEIPKFKNPGRNKRLEEAHTTFNVNIDEELYQLGWCKLTIEEN